MSEKQNLKGRTNEEQWKKEQTEGQRQQQARAEISPWLDTMLNKEAMDHLWNCIKGKKEDAKWDLAGNISKSEFIQDKDNWFFENVLKGMSEILYYKDWENYYNVHVTKNIPPQIFELRNMWVNYQKQNEFNPPHTHNGLFTFVVFMKIPTRWEEQHALPICKTSTTPSASDFMFNLGSPAGNGQVVSISIALNPEDEGRMVFFPAWLSHQVFPFYGTEKERITLSGNVFFPKEDAKDAMFNREKAHPDDMLGLK